jgi:uncharacterized protein
MPAPIVFFDIAGPDSHQLGEFYSSMFDWDIGADGSLTTPVVSPSVTVPSLMGTIRQDPAEKMIYVGVDDITATLAKVEANGGSVDQPRFEVPGVVVLGLFRDPAGNRIGLVEMLDGQAKVP